MQFDLKTEIEKILSATVGLHISAAKKVTHFEDAAPLDQIRWLKARVQELEKKYTPAPKTKSATAASSPV